MIDFLAGATALASLAVALFFLRFWRQTLDRFFLLFALAFATFAINRTALVAIDPELESRGLLYALRLAAFLLIIVAVVDKNRPDQTSSSRREGASRS